MSNNAVTISGSQYTVRGTVTNEKNDEGIVDLHVLVYDEDTLSADDFLGIGVTNAEGVFSVSFDASKFESLFDRRPDLYFIVKDAGTELLNTKDNVISDADESTPPINLQVDISKSKLRALINETPVAGWNGTFSASNPAFAYPNPDLNSLGPLQDNMANIDRLIRQQKVVWPEFSWLSEPGAADPKRCYQMFAPDISRLGYDDSGRVYSIICPQQGFVSPHLGSLNVEVTVTGNRGWANENKGANENMEEGETYNNTEGLAADMSVVGKIWFAPSAHENGLIQRIWNHFKKHNLRFPFNKANAIEVQTYNPKEPNQVAFPLTNGLTTEFELPDFAKHEGVAWRVGHLGVEIGNIKKTGVEIVDKFNQLIMDVFNLASGNMLKPQTVLTWNVWFTAPELVDQEEWRNHAELWRESIQADHGSPDGNGSVARHFDGTPFKPLQELLEEELPKILAFLAEHAID